MGMLFGIARCILPNGKICYWGGVGPGTGAGSAPSGAAAAEAIGISIAEGGQADVTTAASIAAGFASQAQAAETAQAQIDAQARAAAQAALIAQSGHTEPIDQEGQVSLARALPIPSVPMTGTYSGSMPSQSQMAIQIAESVARGENIPTALAYAAEMGRVAPAMVVPTILKVYKTTAAPSLLKGLPSELRGQELIDALLERGYYGQDLVNALEARGFSGEALLSAMSQSPLAKYGLPARMSDTESGAYADRAILAATYHEYGNVMPQSVQAALASGRSVVMTDTGYQLSPTPVSAQQTDGSWAAIDEDGKVIRDQSGNLITTKDPPLVISARGLQVINPTMLAEAMRKGYEENKSAARVLMEQGYKNAATFLGGMRLVTELAAEKVAALAKAGVSGKPLDSAISSYLSAMDLNRTDMSDPKSIAYTNYLALQNAAKAFDITTSKGLQDFQNAVLAAVNPATGFAITNNLGLQGQVFRSPVGDFANNAAPGIAMTIQRGSVTDLVFRNPADPFGSLVVFSPENKGAIEPWGDYNKNHPELGLGTEVKINIMPNTTMLPDLISASSGESLDALNKEIERRLQAYVDNKTFTPLEAEAIRNWTREVQGYQGEVYTLRNGKVVSIKLPSGETLNAKQIKALYPDAPLPKSVADAVDKAYGVVTPHSSIQLLKSGDNIVVDNNSVDEKNAEKVFRKAQETLKKDKTDTNAQMLVQIGNQHVGSDGKFNPSGFVIALGRDLDTYPNKYVFSGEYKTTEVKLESQLGKEMPVEAPPYEAGKTGREELIHFDKKGYYKLDDNGNRVGVDFKTAQQAIIKQELGLQFIGGGKLISGQTKPLVQYGEPLSVFPDKSKDDLKPDTVIYTKNEGEYVAQTKNGQYIMVKSDGTYHKFNSLKDADKKNAWGVCTQESCGAEVTAVALKIIEDLRAQGIKIGLQAEEPETKSEEKPKEGQPKKEEQKGTEVNEPVKLNDGTLLPKTIYNVLNDEDKTKVKEGGIDALKSIFTISNDGALLPKGAFNSEFDKVFTEGGYAALNKALEESKNWIKGGDGQWIPKAVYLETKDPKTGEIIKGKEVIGGYDSLSKSGQEIFKIDGIDSLENKIENAKTILIGQGFAWKDKDGNMQIDIPQVYRSGNDKLIKYVELIYNQEQISSANKGAITKAPSIADIFGVGQEAIRKAGFGQIDFGKAAEGLAFGGQYITSPSAIYNISRDITNTRAQRDSNIKWISDLALQGKISDANAKIAIDQFNKPIPLNATDSDYLGVGVIQQIVSSGMISPDDGNKRVAYLSEQTYSSPYYQLPENQAAFIANTVRSIPAIDLSIKSYDPVSKRDIYSTGEYYIDNINKVDRPIPYGYYYDQKSMQLQKIPEGYKNIAQPVGLRGLAGTPELVPIKPTWYGEAEGSIEATMMREEKLAQEVLQNTSPVFWPAFALSKAIVDLGLIPLMIVEQGVDGTRRVGVAIQQTGEQREETMQAAVAIPVALAAGLVAWFAERPKAIIENPLYETPYTLGMVKGAKFVKGAAYDIPKAIMDYGYEISVLTTPQFYKALGLSDTAIKQTIYPNLGGSEAISGGAARANVLSVQPEISIAKFNPKEMSSEASLYLLNRVQNAVKDMFGLQLNKKVMPTGMKEDVYLDYEGKRLDTEKRNIDNWKIENKSNGDVAENTKGLVRLTSPDGRDVVWLNAERARLLNAQGKPLTVERFGGISGNLRDVYWADTSGGIAWRRPVFAQFIPSIHQAGTQLAQWAENINKSADAGGYSKGAFIPVEPKNLKSPFSALFASEQMPQGFITRGGGEGFLGITILTSKGQREFTDIPEDVANLLMMGRRNEAINLIKQKIEKGEFSKDAIYNTAKYMAKTGWPEEEHYMFSDTYEGLYPVPPDRIPKYMKNDDIKTAVWKFKSSVDIAYVPEYKETNLEAGTQAGWYYKDRYVGKNEEEATSWYKNNIKTPEYKLREGDPITWVFLMTKEAIEDGVKPPSYGQLQLMNLASYGMDLRQILSGGKRRSAELLESVTSPSKYSLSALQTYPAPMKWWDVESHVATEGINRGLEVIDNFRQREPAIRGAKIDIDGKKREATGGLVVTQDGGVILTRTRTAGKQYEPDGMYSSIGGGVEPSIPTFEQNWVKEVKEEIGFDVPLVDTHYVGLNRGMRNNHSFEGNRVYLGLVNSDALPQLKIGEIDNAIKLWFDNEGKVKRSALMYFDEKDGVIQQQVKYFDGLPPNFTLSPEAYDILSATTAKAKELRPDWNLPSSLDINQFKVNKSPIMKTLLANRDADFSKRVLSGKELAREQLGEIAKQRREIWNSLQKSPMHPKLQMAIMSILKPDLNGKLPSPEFVITNAEKIVAEAEKKAETRVKERGGDINIETEREIGKVSEAIESGIRKVEEPIAPEGFPFRIDERTEAVAEGANIINKDGYIFSDKEGIPFEQVLKTETKVSTPSIETSPKVEKIKEEAIIEQPYEYTNWSEALKDYREGKIPESIFPEESANSLNKLVLGLIDKNPELVRKLAYSITGDLSIPEYQGYIRESVKALFGVEASKDLIDKYTKSYIDLKDKIALGVVTDYLPNMATADKTDFWSTADIMRDSGVPIKKIRQAAEGIMGDKEFEAIMRKSLAEGMHEKDRLALEGERLERAVQSAVSSYRNYRDKIIESPKIDAEYLREQAKGLGIVSTKEGGLTTIQTGQMPLEGIMSFERRIKVNTLLDKALNIPELAKAAQRAKDGLMARDEFQAFIDVAQPKTGFYLYTEQMPYRVQSKLADVIDNANWRMNYLRDRITEISDIMAKGVEPVTLDAQRVAGRINNTLEVLDQDFKSLLIGYHEEFYTFRDVADKINQGLIHANDLYEAIVIKAWDKANNALTELKKVFNIIGANYQVVKDLAKFAVRISVEDLSAGIKPIITKVNTSVSEINKEISKIADNIRNQTMQTWGTAQSRVKSDIDGINARINDATQYIESVASIIGSGLKDRYAERLSNMKEELSSLKDKIDGISSEFIDTQKSNLFSSLDSLVRVVEPILEPVGKIAETAYNKLLADYQLIKTNINTLSRNISSQTATTWGSSKNAVLLSIDKLSNQIDNFNRTLDEAKSLLDYSVYSRMGELIENARNKLEDFKDKVADVIDFEQNRDKLGSGILSVSSNIASMTDLLSQKLIRFDEESYRNIVGRYNEIVNDFNLITKDLSEIGRTGLDVSKIKLQNEIDKVNKKLNDYKAQFGSLGTAIDNLARVAIENSIDSVREKLGNAKDIISNITDDTIDSIRPSVIKIVSDAKELNSKVNSDLMAIKEKSVGIAIDIYGKSIKPMSDAIDRINIQMGQITQLTREYLRDATDANRIKAINAINNTQVFIKDKIRTIDELSNVIKNNIVIENTRNRLNEMSDNLGVLLNSLQESISDIRANINIEPIIQKTVAINEALSKIFNDILIASGRVVERGRQAIQQNIDKVNLAINNISGGIKNIGDKLTSSSQYIKSRELINNSIENIGKQLSDARGATQYLKDYLSNEAYARYNETLRKLEDAYLNIKYLKERGISAVKLEIEGELLTLKDWHNRSKEYIDGTRRNFEQYVKDIKKNQQLGTEARESYKRERAKKDADYEYSFIQEEAAAKRILRNQLLGDMAQVFKDNPGLKERVAKGDISVTEFRETFKGKAPFDVIEAEVARLERIQAKKSKVKEGVIKSEEKLKVKEEPSILVEAADVVERYEREIGYRQAPEKYGKGKPSIVGEESLSLKQPEILSVEITPSIITKEKQVIVEPVTTEKPISERKISSTESIISTREQKVKETPIIERGGVERIPTEKPSGEKLPSERIPTEKFPTERPTTEKGIPMYGKTTTGIWIKTKHGDKFLTNEQLQASIAWKQGWAWRLWYPPYGQKDMHVSRTPIPEVEYKEGIRSAYESAKVLFGGDIPDHIKRTMGVVNISAFRGSDKTKPILHFDEVYNKPKAQRHKHTSAPTNDTSIGTFR
jgi:8-oxo-dGTP pyrophosphatase MutT (NUDIX family)